MKQTFTLSSPEQSARAARSRVFTGSMAIGALLMALGAVALFNPLLVGWALSLLLMTGFGLYAGAQLWAYFQTGKEQRSPWTFIGGIVLLGFSAFSLWASFATPYGTALLIAGLANVAALFTMLQGAGQIMTFWEMRRNEIPGGGWVLASGILNAVAGVLIVLQPLLGWMAVTAAWGAYLLITGVSLMAESFSDRRGCLPGT